MHVANHSNLSGFSPELLTFLVASQDRPHEKFLLSGEDLPELILPVLEGARFVERLFRSGTPILIIWIDGFEFQVAHRVCKNVFAPHIDTWNQMLENEDARFFILNKLAMDMLPVYPHVEPISSEDVLEWHDKFNLYRTYAKSLDIRIKKQ